MPSKFDPTLYLVVGQKFASRSLAERALAEIVTEAISGGVTMVQLREKDLSTLQFLENARHLKTLLKSLNVPFIINDRIDIALAVDADGVHLGKDDMPWQEARNLLGPDKIIGLSVDSVDDVIVLAGANIDYVGLGPIFPTTTKKDTGPIIGPAAVSRIVHSSNFPVVAIGGISAENVAEISDCGLSGIAVVSAIMSSAQPALAAKTLLDNFRRSK